MIKIKTREQLLYSLTEAAEIEHNLMCCYLYAAFSLKQDESEGFTSDDVAVVDRWRKSIIHVAVEEMCHLALVSNLMTALGGAPHFGRPNFPITPGYHPAGVQVELAPFNLDTLQHFIYLERPEDSDEPDGKSFKAQETYRRILGEQNRLMPSGQDYETVGELYHALESGLQALSEQYGEENLFVGGVERQIGPELVQLPGLQKISGLNDALQAIETIVEQGEGARITEKAGHFQRFVAIRTEFEEILTTRPDFQPARNAARNPVMRKPVTSGDRVWVSQPDSAYVMDYANALYGQMLRLLSQAFGRAGPMDEKSALLSAAIDLMYAITPAATQLTFMPANDDDDCFGGMSFATLRPLTALPEGDGEWSVLLQRFEELEAAGAALAPFGDRLSASAKAVGEIAHKFEEAVQRFQSRPTSLQTIIEAKPVTETGSPTIDGDTESVDGHDLVLSFNDKRCIHARHCVTGAPKTFLANVEGPWLHPDKTPAHELATIATTCPSGAITIKRKDGVADETSPLVNLCHIRENGPYAVRADIRIDGEPIGFRATLCRCGRSKNKPFCDGAHGEAGFKATGEPETRSLEPFDLRNGPLDIRLQTDGPLAIDGPLEICAGTGRAVSRVMSTKLCRCGGSANKPFCDGTHTRIGFKSD